MLRPREMLALSTKNVPKSLLPSNDHCAANTWFDTSSSASTANFIMSSSVNSICLVHVGQCCRKLHVRLQVNINASMATSSSSMISTVTAHSNACALNAAV